MVAGGLQPLAALHLAFAVGVLPLILAAMLHFVPVLTRTGELEKHIRLIPDLAQITGVLVVAALQGGIPHHSLYLAAAIDMALALWLIQWMWQRSQSALGSPHPGWRWYAAAIFCLLCALLAILLQGLFPGAWLPLRHLHLHLNTLGLVGMAALGTLPVLLPTTLGQADPGAARWLRLRLMQVFAGVVMLALGSAVAWPLSVFGAAMVLIAVLRLLLHWRNSFGIARLCQDGASFSLLSASVAFLLLLISGVVHGGGFTSAHNTLSAWLAGFLAPLLTGALAQLLPVWRWPGPQTPARHEMRRLLVAGAHWRVACFLGSALSLLFGLNQWGAGFLLVGVSGFALALLRAVRVSRSTG